MKLIIIMPTLTKGKGGAERIAAELSNEMARRGHEVTLVAFDKPRAVPAYTIGGSVEFASMPFNSEADVAALRQFVASRSPDLVFYFYFDRYLYQIWAALHDLGFPLGGQECTNPLRMVRNLTRGKLLDPVEAWNVRRAVLSGLHCIRFTMDNYKNSLPSVARPQCATFVNASKPGSKPTADRDEDVRKKIISVGGLKAPNKNGLVLFHSFSKLASDFPDWALHYYGAINLHQIHGLIEKNGLRDRVFLHGSVDDIYDHYASSHIHVICSLEEGCPNVVCEAMQNGVPTIGFDDCPGTNELVRHRQNGLLATRESSVMSLRDNLATLMKSPDSRLKYGLLAWEEAQTRFNEKKIFDQWEQLLKAGASFSGEPDSLFRKQCRIDSDQAHEMRRKRRKIFDKFDGKFFANSTEPKDNSMTEESGLSLNLLSYHKPKLSIIIPVYNKEEHIQETLSSVENFEYESKEIVLVDDVSTDRSLQIVEDFVATSHTNAQIVKRKANGGLSAARNSGLPKSSGDYILFWDADDILDQTGAANIVEMMEADGSDIGCGVATRDGKLLDQYEAANFLKRSTCFDVTPESFSTNSTCFKIYRRKFLAENELKFVPKLFIQDAEFNFRAFCLSNCLTITPYTIGEYRMFDDSGSRSVSPQRFESALKIAQLTFDFTQRGDFQRFESFRQKLILRFVLMFFIRRMVVKGAWKDAEDELAELRKRYLVRFQDLVRSYALGLSEMLISEPRIACALLTFCAGDLELASHLFRRGKPPAGLEAKLLSAKTAISWETITKLRRLPAFEAWAG